MRLIYAIAPARSGPTKIGIANNLAQRLESLQISNWETLYLGYFGAFYIPSPNGAALGLGECFATSERAAYKLEQATHKKLKKMGFHIRGEWFDVSVEDAGAVIEKIALSGGMKHMAGEDFQKYIRIYGGNGSGNRAYSKEIKRFIGSLEFGARSMSEFAALCNERGIS